MDAFTGTARFEVVRRIGAGGMGVVYEVIDRERGLRLALKTLPKLAHSSLYLFKQEFRAISGIAHPNLVVLDALYSEDDQWFFTMEFVDGVTFLQHVRPKPPSAVPSEIAELETLTVVDRTITLAEPEATASQPGLRRASGTCDYARLRESLRQLASGLSALHAAGMLHRDIKPTNVMVTTEGRCLLLDFGLVWELEDSLLKTSESSRAGTIAYMSPEQAAGDTLRESSDWYSVGAMIYEALTGRLPFEGTARQIAALKLTADPALPSSLAPGVPEDLERLCMDLLQRDPDARPSGEEVLQRLEAKPAAHRPRVSASHLFVGRSTHLAALHQALEAVEPGRAVIADVHGVSGAGKSSLISHFLRQITTQPRMAILPGRCYELESVPYKALDNLVDSLSRYLQRLAGHEIRALLPANVQALAQVFPVLGWLAPGSRESRRSANLDPYELRREAFLALRELLAAMAARCRLVLYIDDLQWGDADSAVLLSDILRPPNAPALLLICASRSEYADSPCVKTLRESAPRFGVPMVDVSVDSLEPEDALSMAEQLLGAATEDERALAAAIARESGGNAYFLRELAENLQRGGKAVEAVASGGLSLEEVVWSRVGDLPEEARRLLEVVVVSGQPLAKTDAYYAAGLRDQNPSVLALLRTGHLVRSTGPRQLDEVESYHDRIREIVLKKLPQPAVRCHHESLAVTLEAAGRADAERLALHFDGAGHGAKAGRYYIVAAGKADGALAFDHAAGLYRRAIELLPEDPERRALRVRLADALANAGRGIEAARAYQESADEAEPAEVLELLRKAGYQYCAGGAIDEGRAVFERVLERVRLPKPRGTFHAVASLVLFRLWLALRGTGFRERPAEQVPPELLRRVDAALALGAGMGLIDLFQGMYFNARFTLLALKAGEPSRIARGLALEASAIATEGKLSYRRAQRMLEVCHRLVERLDDPRARATLILAEGMVAFNLGRWAEARRFLEKAEVILKQECTGVAWELDTTRNLLMLALVNKGEYRAVCERSPALMKEALDRGDLYAATFCGAFIEPNARLAEDRPDDALQMVEQSLASWPVKRYYQQHYLADLARGYIHLYRGDGAAAWKQVQRCWPLMKRSLLLLADTNRIFALDLRARCALAAAACASDRDEYLKSAERDARSLERSSLGGNGPAMATARRAGIAFLRGDREKALAELRRAAGQFDALGMELHAQAARRHTGMVREADEWMRDRGIANPARMAAMLIPGFRPADAR